MNLRTIPIFLAFFVMGVADAMGPMADAVQTDYKLSAVMATLLSFFVFIAFAVFSIPGGLLAARIGKKRLLLLGLGLNSVAVLIPSLYGTASKPGYEVLLGCIFVLGVGTAFLQVAGNPIMRDVSAEGGYSRNLSFAQGFKGIGSTASTYLVGAVASLAVIQSLGWDKMGWRGSFPVFFGLMALTFVLVALIRVQETKSDEPPGVVASLRLLTEPIFFLAVLGIFLYVGAEVSMCRFLKPALSALELDQKAAYKYGPAMFLAFLTIGRLLGGTLLWIMSARTCFRLSALLGLVGAAMVMVGSKPLSLAGVVVAGLGFANIWPMLFSITVEERPERANELSGLMCMAISGGAIVPLVMGQVVDSVSITTAFAVPAACFAYLLVLSLKGGHK